MNDSVHAQLHAWLPLLQVWKVPRLISSSPDDPYTIGFSDRPSKSTKGFLLTHIGSMAYQQLSLKKYFEETDNDKRKKIWEDIRSAMMGSLGLTTLGLLYEWIFNEGPHLGSVPKMGSDILLLAVQLYQYRLLQGAWESEDEERHTLLRSYSNLLIFGGYGFDVFTLFERLMDKSLK